MGILNANKLEPTLMKHHRSRKRISELGEVFTPEAYAQKMLDLVTESNWCDEQVQFFEPCCGVGSLLLPTFYRRFNSLANKYQNQGSTDPALRALANTIDSLWAIDICPKNIEQSRTFLFNAALDALKQLSKTSPQPAARSPSKNFVAHLICAISWQITQNETLSALGTAQDALKTSTGIQWIREHEHQQIDFSMPWSRFFIQKNKQGVAPVIF